jgi:hypothetical protein
MITNNNDPYIDCTDGEYYDLWNDDEGFYPDEEE